MPRITPTQAQRAIYIDFEGEGVRTVQGLRIPRRPVLLGVYRRGGRYTRIALRDDGPWTELLARGRAGFPGEARVQDLASAISGLASECQEEDRLLLSYSEHERSVVSRFCPGESDNFEAVWRNAKTDIDAWANRSGRSERHPDINRSLEGYLISIDFPPMTGLPAGPADAIGRLRREMSRIRRWSSLGDRYQDLTRQLVDYNLRDCRGLRRLAVRAANYFASQAR